MSSIAGTFIDDLNNLDELLDSQAAIPGVDTDAIRALQVQGLLTRLSSMPRLDAVSCTSMVRAIATGGWSASDKAALASAVGRLQTSSAAMPYARRSLQTCLTVEGYLTESEWQRLSDDKGLMSTKVHVVADRLRLVGLTNPSENTVKSAAAVVLHFGCHGVHLSQDSKFQLVQHFKTTLRAMTRNYQHPFPHMERYPPTALMLDDPIRHYAYQDDAPAPKECASLAAVAATIPMRSTNKTLAATTGSREALCALDNTANVGALLQNLFSVLGAGTRPLASLSPQSSAGDETDSPLRGLMLCRPPPRPQSAPHALATSARTTDASQEGPTALFAHLPTPAADISDPTHRPPDIGTDDFTHKLLPTVTDNEHDEAPANTTSEDATTEQNAIATMKAKFAAALSSRAEAAEASVPKKRPSAASHQQVLKRPSASDQGSHRPRLPPISASHGCRVPSVIYNGGNIYTLPQKECFRVLKRVGDRVDIKVCWHGYPQQAWSRCLDIIDQAARAS